MIFRTFYDMAGLMSFQILVVLDLIVGPLLGLLVLDATRFPVENLRESLAAVRLTPVCRRSRLPTNSRDGRLASGRGDGYRPLMTPTKKIISPTPQTKRQKPAAKSFSSR